MHLYEMYINPQIVENADLKMHLSAKVLILSGIFILFVSKET